MSIISVSPSEASVEAVKDSTITAWTSTKYYFARLSGPDAPYGDVEVIITAVDDYTLYVNGVEQGSNTDGDWRTAEHYTVTVDGSFVDLAIVVENSGAGVGSGLMVDVVAGSDWMGTTTMKRRAELVGDNMQTFPAIWYYYNGDSTTIENELGEDWATSAPSTLDQASTTQYLTQAINGTMDIGEVDYSPDPHIEVIAGYHGGVDLGSTPGGGVTLRRVEGENLARGKPAESELLTDGEIRTGYSYSSDPYNATLYIDLEEIYRVNEFVIYTGGTSPNEWELRSVRGFAVEVSFDKLRWDEVGIIHNVGEDNEGGHNYASVDFPDEWTRYLRYRITETRQDPPHIAEVMVYGVGYTYEGEYESPWIDFGAPNTNKNFQTLQWEGLRPEGTTMVLQTKTAVMKPDGSGGFTLVESPWSREYTPGTFEFESPEPATMVKYRVKFTTQDINKTATLKAVTFSYSEEDQPVSYANGYVFPTAVPMGEETTFEYTMAYTLQPAEDIKQVEISVPAFSTLNSVRSSELNEVLTVEDNDLTATSANDTLYINFADAIADADGSGADTLYVSFDTKLLRNSHDFYAYLYNSGGNDNAGGMKVWENSDLGSWTVITNSIISGVISEVQAIPKVFTPDNDGVNDFTVIEFSVAKIDADVKINIYNTRGSLVTQIFDGELEPRPYYVPDSQKLGLTQANIISQSVGGDLPGYWDGTDADGDLVPPGVYVYQVIADTDDGEKIESGTVVVGY